MEQLRKLGIQIEWHNGEFEALEVQYNPAEVSLDKNSQLAEIAIPGLDAPLQQFVRGQAEKLSLELFFDTTDKGMGQTVTSVTTETDKIYQLVKIEPERHAPPICTLIWDSNFPGSHVHDKMASQRRHSFRCIAESVQQKFTLFSPNGVPLRAKLNVSFREFRPLEQQLAELKLNSPNRTHSHVVQQGENLATIAAKYYRDPKAWRHIASHNANQIEDPRRIEAGTVLNIPPVV